jgi:hypothetical protein
MMYQASHRPLGVLPLAVGVIAAGSTLEAAWAWYNPNAYGTPFWEADAENKVAILNNAWHHLERTARSVGLSTGDAVMQKLYGDMDQWWQWKVQWNDATIQRWVPFASSRDWDAELNLWLQKFQEDNDALARVAGDVYRKALAKKVDPRFLEPSTGVLTKVAQATQKAANTIAEAPRHALFWPSVGAVAIGIALVWIGSKAAAQPRAT